MASENVSTFVLYFFLLRNSVLSTEQMHPFQIKQVFNTEKFFLILSILH